MIQPVEVCMREEEERKTTDDDTLCRIDGIIGQKFERLRYEMGKSSIGLSSDAQERGAGPGKDPAGNSKENCMLTWPRFALTLRL